MKHFSLSIVFFLKMIQVSWGRTPLEYHSKCDGTPRNCQAILEPYKVKKGDTLSQIIFRYFDNRVYRIYGKGMSLEKVLLLNPTISSSNFLRPGQKINLNLKVPQREIAQDDTIEIEKSPLDDKKGKATNNKEFHRYGRFDIIPRFSYSRIDAVEKVDSSTGKVISKLNYNIDFSYKHIWSKNFLTSLDIGLAQQEYESADNKGVNNPHKTKTSLGLGLQYKVLPILTFSLAGKTAEKPFIKAIDSNTMTIQNIRRPEYSAAIDLTLADLDPFKLDFEILGGFSGKATKSGHSLKNGNFYEGSLKFTQKAKILIIYSDIFYRVERQDSNLITQKTTEVGVGLGCRILFGKE